ncbi:type II toxin-antitoxin system Phd/YefM family antitoxin [Variovorax sp. JS1663]|uniref:type II toxin-antitoxin system Phd/YefM family antitoxin n=1 Tax=Variovorax sp. JS1663 TaxID=1851577 RepID=UPI000B345B49|nr:type II toxin-antitoxin system prevent-host-death family antitoxin [Variovorax sp. JS1663]OUM00639.1 prevent-host-death protein [Variovorax sp. JS1663]
MQTINIHEAKTHLSRIVERVARGESFVIAKAGKPMVKVVPLDVPEDSPPKRLGFLAGQLRVPDDFDTMGSTEIERLFGIAP